MQFDSVDTSYGLSNRANEKGKPRSPRTLRRGSPRRAEAPRGVPPNDTYTTLSSTLAADIQRTLATPIAWIGDLPSPTDERGPVRNHRYITMFDRVEVHVVHMARIVSVVPNSMLPKTSLPYATFTLRYSYR